MGSKAAHLPKETLELGILDMVSFRFEPFHFHVTSLKRQVQTKKVHNIALVTRMSGAAKLQDELLSNLKLGPSHQKATVPLPPSLA